MVPGRAFRAKFCKILQQKYFGTFQPGCSKSGYVIPKLVIKITGQSDIKFKSGLIDALQKKGVAWAGCSHIRATEYFIKSIKEICKYNIGGNRMGWYASPNGTKGKIVGKISKKKNHCLSV